MELQIVWLAADVHQVGGGVGGAPPLFEDVIRM